MGIVEIRFTGITGLAECISCTTIVSFKREVANLDAIELQLENIRCPRCRAYAIDLLETTVLPLYEIR